MSKYHLRIGRISFTNLFPLFYNLERSRSSSSYEFVEGVPSTLNRMLREGRIDISPSSSIEYLRNTPLYTLIDGHSISSAGPIKSILLFSRIPLERLDGMTVLTTSQSETSVALLDIILKKFLSISCHLLATDAPLSEGIETHAAHLLIGDDALGEALKRPHLHVYDLAEFWYEKTGLPFVFALWIAQKGCCERAPELFEQFKRDLDQAKNRALENLEMIAKESPLCHRLSQSEILSYWRGISYDLTERHKKGLNLFRAYASELKLIEGLPCSP